jgi:hypothetical protein
MLYDILCLVGQPVDAGHDQALECVGDGDRLHERRCHPGCALFLQRSALDQGANGLLDKERIALSFIRDQLRQVGRQVGHRQQLAHHLAACGSI